MLIQFPSEKIYTTKNLCWLAFHSALFLIGALDFLTGGKVVGTPAISILLLPFLPVFLLDRLTSKIKFDDEYVEKITITGKTRIQISDIQSFGIYTWLRPFSPKVADPTEVDENSLFATNKIFISTANYFAPMTDNRGESITFQYREDIYELIKGALKELPAKHPRYKRSTLKL